MRVTAVGLAAVLVAGLFAVPAPAMAGGHDPDCAAKELSGSWLCASETGGGNGGGGGSDGWAVWRSRIYTARYTTETNEQTGEIVHCVMAYPNGGPLTGPEVLDEIEAAQGAHDRYEEALQEYEAAKEAYEEAVAEYEQALQALEQAEEARDDEEADADPDADAAPDAGEGQEAAQNEGDAEAARARKEEAEAAMAAAQDQLQEADERRTEAEEALDGFPFDIVPGERPRACGSGDEAKEQVRAPSPKPDIKPGSALTGITSYLEIDFDDERMRDERRFVDEVSLPPRTYVLEAKLQSFHIKWGDGTEDDTRRRGEPYPGGPEEITHTYTVADVVEVEVRATWVEARLLEVLDDGTLGTATELHDVTSRGTLEDFPVQQAQAVRVR